MMSKLVQRAKSVVGFAFDIEKASERKSGFRPAKEHLGSENPNPMYADPRLEGYAAMLRLGYTEQLIIPGKDERRYKSELVDIDGQPSPIWQGWTIREMLVKDFGCDGTCIRWVSSTGTTMNAALAIQELAEKEKMEFGWGKTEFATSYYHCIRTGRVSLQSIGLPSYLTPAEAFTVAEAIILDKAQEAEDRLRSFGGHFTDERIINEIRGIAHHLLGRYEPQRKGW